MRLKKERFVRSFSLDSRALRVAFRILAGLAAGMFGSAAHAVAAGPGILEAAAAGRSSRSVLTVDGEKVTVLRDEFGVPHIFAHTNRDLFEAYGYVVAEDRLWQLELNRRAARGRLSEILGRGTLAADTLARTVGYTDAELDAQFSQLNAEEQEIFLAYRDGINRYIEEVVAKDPLKLPFEFQALGFFPAPWEIRDSVAFGAFMTRRFGEIGGRELTNQTLLADLIGRFGERAGYAAFNDVRWLNDPDSPVTVPVDVAVARRQSAKPFSFFRPEQLQGASETSPDTGEAEAIAIWERLGVVTKLGSYAWVISPERSSSGFAMLYGGPQMGFSAPEVLHEVQLTGGRHFDVTGMAFAGVPAVLIGRNGNVAWTSTTATGDNVDIYVETLCAPDSYLFRRVCTPMESRVEAIAVRGENPVNLTVLRTVHGPVVAAAGPFVFSQKRAHWQREIETISPFLAFDRAKSLREFEEAVRQVVTSHNFLYADQRGNIAYWQAGQVPVRPEGFDPRLPLPGEGSAEWPGGILPMPTSVNPEQGFLANWNNKPSVHYDNADNQIFGKQFRLWDINDRLAHGPITLEDMREIPQDIARVKGLGREARFLNPFLLEALDAVPPSHPLAGRARDVLSAWEGSAFEDAVTSTTLQAGEVIFSAWLNRMLTGTFGDELGNRVGEASTNMLIHVLDFVFTGSSGVPPSRDYFNGIRPRVAMSATFDQVVAALAAAQGNDPEAWTGPRGNTDFNHPLIGLVGRIPASNRATYAQIVVLSRRRIESENIFTLGQSGFIQFVPPDGFELDPHFRDQLDLFRDFQYKPMRLFKNAKGEE